MAGPGKATPPCSPKRRRSPSSEAAPVLRGKRESSKWSSRPAGHRLARRRDLSPDATRRQEEDESDDARCGHERAHTASPLELLQRVDPVLRSRMAGEEPSPAGALCLQEPGQRIDY